jgi:hypothetical protein
MVDNTGEQQMSKNVELFVVGAEIDLKDASQAKKFGRSRIINIERAPRSANTTFHFESVATGKTWHWKFRDYLDGACNRLATYASVAKKATAETTKKAADKQRDLNERDYAAYKDVIITQNIQPGDIVTITTPNKNYDFKVCEIDFAKGRLKGFNVETSYTRVGSRMGWANYKHPDVTVKLKQKNAFDVSLDACYNAHKAEAADVGAKRAETRARKKELRDRFGW